jgi:hypothetical protein
VYNMAAGAENRARDTCLFFVEVPVIYFKK